MTAAAPSKLKGTALPQLERPCCAPPDKKKRASLHHVRVSRVFSRTFLLICRGASSHCHASSTSSLCRMRHNTATPAAAEVAPLRRTVPCLPFGGLAGVASLKPARDMQSECDSSSSARRTHAASASTPKSVDSRAAEPRISRSARRMPTHSAQLARLPPPPPPRPLLLPPSQSVPLPPPLPVPLPPLPPLQLPPLPPPLQAPTPRAPPSFCARGPCGAQACSSSGAGGAPNAASPLGRPLGERRAHPCATPSAHSCGGGLHGTQ